MYVKYLTIILRESTKKAIKKQLLYQCTNRYKKFKTGKTGKKNLFGRIPLRSEDTHWTVVPSKKMNNKKRVKFALSYSFICAESTALTPTMSECISFMIGKFIVCCSDLQWMIIIFDIRGCEFD
jgi:hypothetical protein